MKPTLADGFPGYDIVGNRAGGAVIFDAECTIDLCRPVAEGDRTAGAAGGEGNEHLAALGIRKAAPCGLRLGALVGGCLDIGLPHADQAFGRLFSGIGQLVRSEEHTSELQSLMRISYAVFCLQKKKINTTSPHLKCTIPSTPCYCKPT